MKDSTKTKFVLALAAIVLALGIVPLSALAQVPSRIAIQSGNGGSIFAPTNPNGFINIGPYVWITDAKGMMSYLPDLTNPTPLETSSYPFNLNPNWSIDNNVCIPFCSAGQVAKINDTVALIAVWDHSMGGRNGGIWLFRFQNPLPDPNTSVFPWDGASPLAQNKGLGGNQATAVALGPDGGAYFGNLKNNNLLRIPQALNTDPNQNVITVGNIGTARSIYALAFNGSQLYAGADNGFWVFGATSDITQCSGNANNCGTPKQLMSGTSVNGVASDGLGHVYFVTVNGGFLYRYNVTAGTFTQVDAGLLIEKGHTSTVGFDKDGNLWVGEQPVADLPNGGLVRVYLATDLAGLP
jgi:hypothetical protein